LKHYFNRPRPPYSMADAHMLVGLGQTASMPSGHAMNWFAGAVAILGFYRKIGFALIGFAICIGFSRVYNGVHYPSDVIVGAILGSALGGFIVWGGNRFWLWAGRRWFPWWWIRLPSILHPELVHAGVPPEACGQPQATLERQWLRLGYVSIFVLLTVRLLYLAAGRIELSEDEAYQWLWSKHLALSYYSKPPMIAYAQYAGTWLWGDTQFGVRFWSPVMSAVLGCVLLRFFAREVNARLGCLLIWMTAGVPLLAVGAVLFTVDPLLVFFGTLSMISGWRALHSHSKWPWFWTGLWLGLASLSKYTAWVQLVSWAVFLAGWKPARKHLRQCGPYLALLVSLLCLIPVLLWNGQHEWITVRHVAADGGFFEAWKPTFKHFFAFVGAQAGLLNPVFFLGLIWMVVAAGRRLLRHELWFYLLCMGTPVAIGYTLLSFHTSIMPNWTASAVLPLLCLTALYWESRWRGGQPGVIKIASAGIFAGFVMVAFLHEPRLIQKITGRSLPPKSNPLTRVSGWRQTSTLVMAAREKLLAEGKPVFIIGDHYGITSQIAFYSPEAQSAPKSEPWVYCKSSAEPVNQFYFWPGYGWRRGQNAIFVQKSERLRPPPERLASEFESIIDLGIHEVKVQETTVRSLHLFACRNLR
jgi:4-amino-4-deoxy-L-arabinose transferase-like glycosyltransferase